MLRAFLARRFRKQLPFRFERRSQKCISRPGLGFRSRLEVLALEDRTVPSVTVTALGDAHEGGSDGGFRFTRSDTTGALSISVNLSGTAVFGTDYGYGEAFQIAFPNGVGSVDWTVAATNDSTSEPTETVTASVTSGGVTSSDTLNIW